jgi:hypothetical protein
MQFCRSSNTAPGECYRATKRDNRSAILEEAAWEFLRSRRRAARDAGELRLLNEAAAGLNDEAFDTLDYQDIK